MKNKRKQCFEALQSLYIAVDKSIADDVFTKVTAYIDEIEPPYGRVLGANDGIIDEPEPTCHLSDVLPEMPEPQGEGGGEMTLQEWTTTMCDELKAGGFDVSEYQGFPLVKRPASIEDGVRLLEFHTTYAATRKIYSEGMLFIPVGTPDNPTRNQSAL